MKRRSSRTCCAVRMPGMLCWWEERKRMWREATQVCIAASPAPRWATLQLTGIRRAAAARI